MSEQRPAISADERLSRLLTPHTEEQALGVAYEYWLRGQYPMSTFQDVREYVISKCRASVVTTGDKLAAIEALCRRHAHPGCNSGAHELACKVLRIIRGENDA